MQTIEFFFDYLSPYAYLAWPQVRGVCARRGVELIVSPVLLAGLLQHWGQLGPAEIPPKMLFAFKDCARSAALVEMPFRAPRYHPFNPLTALRVSLLDVAGADQEKVVDALFHAGWGTGADLGSTDSISRVLDREGLDGEALVLRATQAPAKEALRSATRRAIDHGVFGVPTMIVDGELFWGSDQLGHVERRVVGTDPIDSIDLVAMMPEGASAERQRS